MLVEFFVHYVAAEYLSSASQLLYPHVEQTQQTSQQSGSGKVILPRVFGKGEGKLKVKSQPGGLEDLAPRGEQTQDDSQDKTAGIHLNPTMSDNFMSPVNEPENDIARRKKKASRLDAPNESNQTREFSPDAYNSAGDQTQPMTARSGSHSISDDVSSELTSEQAKSFEKMLEDAIKKHEDLSGATTKKIPVSVLPKADEGLIISAPKEVVVKSELPAKQSDQKQTVLPIQDEPQVKEAKNKLPTIKPESKPSVLLTEPAVQDEKLKDKSSVISAEVSTASEFVPTPPERDEEQIASLLNETQNPPPVPADEEAPASNFAPPAPPPPPPAKIPVFQGVKRIAGQKKEIAPPALELMDQLKDLLARRNRGEFQLRKGKSEKVDEEAVIKKLTFDEQIQQIQIDIASNASKISSFESQVLPGLEEQLAIAIQSESQGPQSARDLATTRKVKIMKEISDAKKEVAKLNESQKRLASAIKLIEKFKATAAARKARAEAAGEDAPQHMQLKKRALSEGELKATEVALGKAVAIFDLLSDQDKYYIVNKDKDVFEKLALLNDAEIAEISDQLQNTVPIYRYGDLRKNEILYKMNVVGRKAENVPPPVPERNEENIASLSNDEPPAPPADIEEEVVNVSAHKEVTTETVTLTHVQSSDSNSLLTVEAPEVELSQAIHSNALTTAILGPATTLIQSLSNFMNSDNEIENSVPKAPPPPNTAEGQALLEATKAARTKAGGSVAKKVAQVIPSEKREEVSKEVKEVSKGFLGDISKGIFNLKKAVVVKLKTAAEALAEALTPQKNASYGTDGRNDDSDDDDSLELELDIPQTPAAKIAEVRSDLEQNLNRIQELTPKSKEILKGGFRNKADAEVIQARRTIEGLKEENVRFQKELIKLEAQVESENKRAAEELAEKEAIRQRAQAVQNRLKNAENNAGTGDLASQLEAEKQKLEAKKLEKAAEGSTEKEEGTEKESDETIKAFLAKQKRVLSPHHSDNDDDGDWE